MEGSRCVALPVRPKIRIHLLPSRSSTMDVTGLTASLVALAGLFTTCVECWDYIESARVFSRDYEILTTQLDIEKTRFLIWGEVVGLLQHDQRKQAANLKWPIVQKNITRILNCIQTIFTDTDALTSRYGLRLTDSLPLPSNSSKLGSKQVSKFRETYQQFQARVNGGQSQTGLLRKTRWAIHDRAKFGRLVDDLKQLITGLKEISSTGATNMQEYEIFHDEMEELPLGAVRLVHEASALYHPDLSKIASEVFELSVMGSETGGVEKWIDDLPSLAGDHNEDRLKNLLIDLKLDVNTEPSELLRKAAMLGSEELVSLLLHQGLDVDILGSDGTTPLLWAVRGAHTDVAKCLLKQGANISATDVDSRTAMHLAAAEGHVTVVKLLLQFGADVEAEDVQGNTPLTEAVSRQYEDVVRVLVMAGAGLENQEELISNELICAADFGYATIVRMLLRAGANVNIRAKGCGSTPAHEAARDQNRDVLRILIEAGADTEARDSYSMTPLHYAAWHGENSTVQLLIKAGANINVQDNPFHRSPMSGAAHNGHTDIVRILLEAGAEIEPIDAKGETALIYAAKSDYLDIVKLLLDKGADTEHKTRKGRTILMYAAEHGKDEVVRLLLRYNANMEARDSNQQTSIMTAAGPGRRSTVQLLASQGANVHVRDRFGRTIIHMAAAWGKTEVIDDILKLGVPVDDVGHGGETALFLAAKYGHPDAVKLLLKRGASRSIRNGNLATLLDIARRKGHEAVTQILLTPHRIVDGHLVPPFSRESG